jgi:hypothetical protein
MKILLALTAAVGLTFSVPASAAILSFDLTGDYTASWSLDSNPTPQEVDGISFTLWDVFGSFPGSAFDVVDLRFYEAAALGGLTIVDFFGGGVTLIDAIGGQLFSGTLNSPMFAPGTYDLLDFDGREYTLVISDPNGVIPEPATWAMMIAGFGLVGFAARRRSRAVAA